MTLEVNMSLILLIKQMSHFLNYYSAWASVICLLALTALITLSIITRWAFNVPIMGADELSGYLNVFIGFLALGYTLDENRHVRVDMVTNRLKPKTRDIIELLTIPLAIILTVQFIKSGWYTWRVILDSDERAQTYLMTPLAIPYGVMLFSWCLFLLAIVVRYLTFIASFFTRSQHLQDSVTARKEPSEYI